MNIKSVLTHTTAAIFGGILGTAATLKALDAEGPIIEEAKETFGQICNKLDIEVCTPEMNLQDIIM